LRSAPVTRAGRGVFASARVRAVKVKDCPARPGRPCSWLIDRERLVGKCAYCGRTLPFDPIPVIPRARRR
jgi:hypothetical protein